MTTPTQIHNRNPPESKAIKQPRANEPPHHHPHEIIKRAKDAGIRDCVIAFSGGKDAIATLDLCVKNFDSVWLYFLYIVPGLSWEEESLQWAERTYGVEIHRLPHPSLSKLFRDCTFRHGTKQATECPLLTPRQIDNYCRHQSGFRWVAAGERASDSLERQAYIKHSGGVDATRLRFYPIGFWREQDVLSYLSRNRLPTPRMYLFKDDPHFQKRGKKRQQFGGFQLDTVSFIQERMPEDFAKIKELFPLIEGQYSRAKVFEAKAGHEQES